MCSCYFLSFIRTSRAALSTSSFTWIVSARSGEPAAFTVSCSCKLTGETNSAAGLWAMYEMYRHVRACKNDHLAEGVPLIESSTEFAIVLTDGIENINDCLFEKQESKSHNEKVRVFVIGENTP